MTKKIASFLLAIAVTLAFLPPQNIRATEAVEIPENPQPEYEEDLTPSAEELGRISGNCSSIKLQLQRVQRADAKSRVHLGAQYETISTNLMLNLNLRLVKNNVANAELADQQTRFFSERERFKNDFIGYSQELEKLIQINCKEHPQEFYDQLILTRQKRSDVQQSIYRLQELIDYHRNSVETLRSLL